MIDCKLRELNDRFPEQTIELLILSSVLDPHNSFKSLNIEHLCKLAEKFYPAYFIPSDLKALEIELWYFQNDMHTTLPQLCQQLMETTLGENYYLIDMLIRLVLTFPVPTANNGTSFLMYENY